MDIQSRKIAFIQEFLKIQNESILNRFEELLKNTQENVSQMSVDELNNRIDKSLSDSKKDKVVLAEELLQDIENWR